MVAKSQDTTTFSRAAAGPAENDKPVRSIEALDAAIRSIASRINAATCELLVLVREFDDRFGWAKWSFRNGTEWLAWRSGISLSAAREQLRTAHALRRLPAISRAFADGKLSYTKVRALTRVAEPHNEDLLLAWALDATAPQVEERCRQMRNVAPESTDDARRAWARRALTIWRNAARGTMIVNAEIPVDAGELLIRALERAIETGEAASGPEFEHSGWQAQQADALIALARTYLAGGSGEGAAAPEPYQVVVHVDAEALGAAAVARPRAGLGQDGSAGEGGEETTETPDREAGAGNITDSESIPDKDKPLHGGAARTRPVRSDLPIEVIRRLSCDGMVIPISEDRTGNPLNVGRQRRIVPPALRRALWSRDRGCTFPGCGRTRWVHAHHLRHWADGGETSLENTLLLCSHHHRLMHEGGFRIRRAGDGGLCFERPDGRVIPRCGYRIEDAAPDPVHLQGRSAEAWLAEIAHSARPPGAVRERPGVYHVNRASIRIDSARGPCVIRSAVHSLHRPP